MVLKTKEMRLAFFAEIASPPSSPLNVARSSLTAASSFLISSSSGFVGAGARARACMFEGGGAP